jgi:hypothetical protein
MLESGKNIEAIAKALYDPTIPKASGRYVISRQTFEALQQSDVKRYTPIKAHDEAETIYVWNGFSLYIKNNSQPATKVEGNMIKLIRAMKSHNYNIIPTVNI